MMPNSDPEGRIFLSAPNSHDRLFFLHTLWSPAFDFYVEVAINYSRFYTLMCAISKFDVVCDIAMTSSPNDLTTELPDLLYNRCIGNTCSYSFVIYPTDRIRICKIRFVGTGKNHRKSCLVCKKTVSSVSYVHKLKIIEIQRCSKVHISTGHTTHNIIIYENVLYFTIMKLPRWSQKDHSLPTKRR